MSDASLYVQAGRIGEKFMHDPELSLPERPYFPPEIVVVPYQGKGLLFEGVRGRQVVLGASTRMFIPQLLTRLDGRHTVEHLCAQFPSVPRKSMNDALALLFSRGLLEDGCPRPDPAPSEAQAQLAAFAGRFADVTRVNRNRDAVLERLAQARVVVAGLPGHEGLLRALEGQCLGGLRVASSPDELQDAGELLVALFVGDDDGAAAWMRRANSLSMRVLHAHVAADAAEIGPLFVPGISGCYDCFRQLHPMPGGAPEGDLGFWTGVLALNALHLLSRLGPVGLFNTCRVSRHTPHGKLYDEVKLARLPGCATCGLADCGPPATHPDTRAWLYHNACDAMPYHALRNPRDHQQHYAATNVQLSEQPPKPYYGAPVTALPAGAPPAVTPPWYARAPRKDRLALADLASALRCASGYQDSSEGLRRIAPSGGGLGAANLYVIARRVDGLAPGIYHYSGHGHCLERVGEAADEVLEGALGAAASPLPDAVIVGTAHLVKLRRKYDNFAFRLASLDAGVAKALCIDVLAALGVPHAEYPDARDKVLASVLRMPVLGSRNMVTFALGLGGQGKAALASGHHHYPDGLIEMSSQLGAARIAAPRRALPAMPPMPSAVPPMENLVLERRSLRTYADQTLLREILEQILTAAAAIDEDCVAAGGLGLRMTLWAVVTAGEPGAGVYRWNAETRMLTRRSATLSMPLLEACMSQRGFAQAPVVVFVTGDFEQALTAHGPRGYRDMLNRAGSMMLRLLLAGTGLGVGGCMWGGVTEEACGRLLGVDRYRDCPLIGASLGYADHAG